MIELISLIASKVVPESVRDGNISLGDTHAFNLSVDLLTDFQTQLVQSPQGYGGPQVTHNDVDLPSFSRDNA